MTLHYRCMILDMNSGLETVMAMILQKKHRERVKQTHKKISDANGRTDDFACDMWLIDEDQIEMGMGALKIWRQLNYLLCNKCLNDMQMHSNNNTNQCQITAAISIQFLSWSFYIFHTYFVFSVNHSAGIRLRCSALLSVGFITRLYRIYCGFFPLSWSDGIVYGERLVITTKFDG